MPVCYFAQNISIQLIISHYTLARGYSLPYIRAQHDFVNTQKWKLIMHPSTAHSARLLSPCMALGFVPCVDHLSLEEATNKSYQNMRKTEKNKNNYFLINFRHVCSQNCTKDIENICIHSFIHHFAWHASPGLFPVLYNEDYSFQVQTLFTASSVVLSSVPLMSKAIFVFRSAYAIDLPRAKH
jgi:hypothetical protein